MRQSHSGFWIKSETPTQISHAPTINPFITMARLLAARDSTTIHLNLSRRHQRLARRYRQTAMADVIRPFILALKDKADLAEERDLDRQAADDAVSAADADLDDAVRNLFDSAKIAERNDLTGRLLDTLFPDGRFTTITDAADADEPALVEALITRLASLGGNHPLAPHVALLRTAISEVNAAFKAYDEAVTAVQVADAAESLAASNLRKQYEANYFDARKQLNRPLAERLFPASRSSGPSPAAPVPAPAPQK
jgi:hypothetical protein